MSNVHSTDVADRLAADLADIHVPEPNADAEAWLTKLGLVLPLAGVILIGVGWWGASGTARVAEQIPLLISGGVLGLGLAVIGVGLYLRFSLARVLRFWLARVVVEQQAQTDRVVEALARIEASLDRD